MFLFLSSTSASDLEEKRFINEDGVMYTYFEHKERVAEKIDRLLEAVHQDESSPKMGVVRDRNKIRISGAQRPDLIDFRNAIITLSKMSHGSEGLQNLLAKKLVARGCSTEGFWTWMRMCHEIFSIEEDIETISRDALMRLLRGRAEMDWTYSDRFYEAVHEEITNVQRTRVQLLENWVLTLIETVAVKDLRVIASFLYEKAVRGQNPSYLLPLERRSPQPPPTDPEVQKRFMQSAQNFFRLEQGRLEKVEP